MSIQRWYIQNPPGQPTEFVSYADHVAALRACEQRSYALGIEVGKHDGWLAGHSAGVQAARDAVAALPFVRPAYYGKGVLIHGAEPDFVRSSALAAIDALKEEDK